MKKKIYVSLEKLKQSKPILSILYLIQPLRNMIKKMYAWTIKWSESKHATTALLGLTAAEASFFPLPTDPLLMAMIFAKPKRWLKLVFSTISASVIGAMFGYFIGFVLFESIGQTIISALHLEKSFPTVQQYYESYSFLVIIVAAFTPLPFKLFTIAAGVFRVNFIGFVAASIVGRSLRYGLVGALAHFLGRRYKDQIEKYVDTISLIIMAIIIIVYLLTRLL